MDYINQLDKDIMKLSQQMEHAYKLMRYYDGVNAVGYAMAHQAYKETKAEWSKLCDVANALEQIANITTNLYANHSDVMHKYGIDI